jgi:hypothetical protein
VVHGDSVAKLLNKIVEDENDLLYSRVLDMSESAPSIMSLNLTMYIITPPWWALWRRPQKEDWVLSLFT